MLAVHGIDPFAEPSGGGGAMLPPHEAAAAEAEAARQAVEEAALARRRAAELREAEVARLEARLASAVAQRRGAAGPAL